MLNWLKKVFLPAVEDIDALVLEKQVIEKKAELTKMTKVQLTQLMESVKIEGKGMIKAQSIKPGLVAGKGDEITLELS